jgi:hypothetical protein
MLWWKVTIIALKRKKEKKKKKIKELFKRALA